MNDMNSSGLSAPWFVILCVPSSKCLRDTPSDQVQDGNASSWGGFEAVEQASTWVGQWRSHPSPDAHPLGDIRNLPYLSEPRICPLSGACSPEIHS